MRTIQCSNLQSTNYQIKALEAILPYDSDNDREAHEVVINDLKNHREKLMQGGRI